MRAQEGVRRRRRDAGRVTLAQLRKWSEVPEGIPLFESVVVTGAPASNSNPGSWPLVVGVEAAEPGSCLRALGGRGRRPLRRLDPRAAPRAPGPRSPRPRGRPVPAPWRHRARRRRRARATAGRVESHRGGPPVGRDHLRALCRAGGRPAGGHGRRLRVRRLDLPRARFPVEPARAPPAAPRGGGGDARGPVRRADERPRRGAARDPEGGGCLPAPGCVAPGGAARLHGAGRVGLGPAHPTQPGRVPRRHPRADRRARGRGGERRWRRTHAARERHHLPEPRLHRLHLGLHGHAQGDGDPAAIREPTRARGRLRGPGPGAR